MLTETVDTGRGRMSLRVSGRREICIRHHQFEITIKWNPFIHPFLHLPLMCQTLRDQEEQEDRHRQRQNQAQSPEARHSGAQEES